jgi:hypothetical protein
LLVVLALLAAVDIYQAAETSNLKHAAANANRQIFQAAQGAHSLHYTLTTQITSAGATEIDYAQGDVGPNSGIQRLWGAQGNATVIVVHAKAYIKADMTGLENLLNYSPAQASQYAQQWIAISPTDTPYDQTIFLVTSNSLWSDPTQSPIAPFAQNPTQMTHGQPNPSTDTLHYAVDQKAGTGTGPVHGTATTEYSASRPYLPIASSDQVTGKFTDGTAFTQSDHATYSHWTQKVDPLPPGPAIAFATLPPPAGNQAQPAAPADNGTTLTAYHALR